MADPTEVVLPDPETLYDDGQYRILRERKTGQRSFELIWAVNGGWRSFDTHGDEHSWERLARRLSNILWPEHFDTKTTSRERAVVRSKTP